MKKPITYTNRKGDIYHLKKKETPKGKTRYAFAKSGDGSLLSHIRSTILAFSSWL